MRCHKQKLSDLLGESVHLVLINNKKGMNMFNKIKLSLIALSLMSSSAYAGDIFLKKDAFVCDTYENFDQLVTANINEDLNATTYLVENNKCFIFPFKTEATILISKWTGVRKVRIYPKLESFSEPMELWTSSEFLGYKS